METGYLKEFLELSKVRNYHAAAKELDISQATLTNHIKALEKELKVPLFERNTRSVSLSSYGKIFVGYAERFSELLEDCAGEMESVHSDDKSILRITVEPHYMVGDLIKIITSFKNENSDVAVEFMNAPENRAHDQLKTGRCDIAITPQTEREDPDFNTYCIREEKAVAVVKSDSSLAGRSSVRIAELKNETLFMQPDRLCMSKLFNEECIKAGFTPNIGCMGVSEAMGVLLVEQGLGIAILSDYSAKKMISSAFAAVDIEPNIKWYLNLIYKDTPNFSLKYRFLDYLSRFADISGEGDGNG